MLDSLDHYNIFYRKNSDSTFLFLDSIHAEHFTGYYYAPARKIEYNVKHLSNNTVYEFVIQAVNKTKTESSFSNMVNFETQFEDNTPVALEISCVSVIDDRYIQIEVRTDSFINPFQKLYLFRDESVKCYITKDSLQFHLIDSLNYAASNHYSFTDENVHPKTGLYYYMAIADNRCRFNDSSNIQTNIWLYGNRAEKFLDSVHFVHAGFPELDIHSYELLRMANETEKLIFNALLSDSTYFIDVNPFIEDGVVIKYKIKSEQGCFSNSLIIEHEPIIEFPNAFYPQSKHVENTTFYPILKFPSEKNYLFIIYNRWGQEVYRSSLPPVYGEYSNMQGRWDGTFQGGDCPAGVYGYKISYTYNERSGKHSESGTFMLVR
jgi:hypothetical protein